MIMVGASAYPRVIDFPRIAAVATAVGAPMVVDMAHIAGLVAAGLHPSPVPHADFVTSTTHKTLRGPRSGLILCREQYAKDLDRSVFPGIQGGPLMHIIAAKAVCFKEAMEPAFKDYQRQIVANAQRLAGAIASQGFRIVSGGTDNHLMLVDVFSKGIDRQGRRGRARQGRHHGEQERDPVRSEPADGGERHPHRHARADHARHARAGDGSHRRTDRSRPRRPRR